MPDLANSARRFIQVVSAEVLKSKEIKPPDKPGSGKAVMKQVLENKQAAQAARNSNNRRKRK